MLILPMVAQVAADEPETAAKIVQPMMLVCSRRPGMRVIQGARPRNMSSDSLVRKRISPIQMNIGRAVSVQLEDAPQMVVTMASPTGREVNSAMAIQPQASRPRPIHRPAANRAKRATIRKTAMMIWSTAGILFGAGEFGGLIVQRFAAQNQDEFLDEGDAEDHRAERHADLRNPQRRRIVGSADVVELPRPPGHLHAVEGEGARNRDGQDQGKDLEGAARLAGEAADHQGHADMVAVRERAGEREE